MRRERVGVGITLSLGRAMPLDCSENCSDYLLLWRAMFISGLPAGQRFPPAFMRLVSTCGIQ